MSPPLEIGKCSTQTAPKSFLWGKSPSESHSSTVNSAIIMPEVTGTIAQMMAHGVLIHQTQILIKSNQNKMANPVTIHQHQPLTRTVPDLLFLQYPRKAGGQVTVAATVTAIITPL